MNMKKKAMTAAICLLVAYPAFAQTWNFEDETNLAQGEIQLDTTSDRMMFSAGQGLSTSNVVMGGGGGVFGLEFSVSESSNSINWVAAAKFCHELDNPDDKGGGWRLPTIVELASGQGEVWKQPNSYYWSSMLTDGSQAWVFRPSDGSLNLNNSNYYYARCVRSVIQ